MVHPELWGNHGWKFLHYVTLDYPENPTNHDKKKYKEFFNLLQYTLPCEKCRNHYKQNIKNHKLTDEILSDDKKLIYWLIDFHNIVNESTGKEIVDRDEAFNLLYYKAKFIDSNENIKINLENRSETEKIKNFSSDIKPVNKIKISEKKENNNFIMICLIPLLIIAFVIYKKNIYKK